MAFCKNCGGILNENDKYCGDCGTKVDNTALNKSIENNQEHNTPKYTRQLKQTDVDSLHLNSENKKNSKFKGLVSEFIKKTINESQEIENNEASPKNEKKQKHEKNSEGLNYQLIISNFLSKLLKNKKLILGVSATVLLIFFLTYKIGASITDRDKLIEKFNNALTARDTKQVESMLNCQDQRVVINQKCVEGLFGYMDKNPKYISELIKSLKFQNQKIELNIGSYSTGNNKYTIALKKSGKKFLFFDYYTFEVLPVFINVSVDLKDTEIYVNDTKVCVSDNEKFTKKIGPYFPGIYKIKLVYKGKYATLQKVSEVEGLTVNNAFKEAIDANVEMGGKFVQIDCKEVDAEVFVNGQDTGLTVSQINKTGLGPVNSNVKVHLEKDFPWGKSKSKEVNINGKTDTITISMEGQNADIDSIINAVSNYERELINAYTDRDVSKVQTATQNRINELANQIDEMNKSDEKFKGNILKQDFDISSFKIDTASGNNNEAYIIARNYYNSVVYRHSFFGNDNPRENQNICQYKLIYNTQANTWQIDQAYNTNDISTNIKTITY